jgi:hypothetical protein
VLGAVLAASCGGAQAPPSAPPAATVRPSAAGAPGAPSAVTARIDALFERGLQRGDEASLARAFGEMRAVARPEERPFIDRLERLAHDARAEDDLDGLIRLMTAALTDLERLAPDRDARLAIAQQAYALALSAAGEPAGAAADGLAIGASERLVRDHADDPRAWGLRAQVLRRIQEDLRGAWTAARRCAAEHPPCAELTWQLVREIEVPRCHAADLRPGFALHRGNRQGAHEAAPRAIDAGGAPMWIVTAPSVTASDVAEIAGGEGALLVTLTPDAAPKLEAFREQVARVDAAAAVLVEGRFAGAATRLVPMARGKLLLASDPAAPLSLDAVCAQIVRERAPG